MVTDQGKFSLKDPDLPHAPPSCKAGAFRAAMPPSPGCFFMRKPDLVIFDCDGVLVDSEIVATRVEAQMITKGGYPIEVEELIQNYAGLPFKNILLRIEKEAGIPFQASLIDECEATIDKRLAVEKLVIEGVAAAVSALRVPYCICSNSSTQRIRFMLGRAGLGPLFEGRIYSSLETPSGRPKPAPDVFLHAAEAMGADPARTFVIEDSVHGITGARAAGMRVIGFTGGSHSYPGHADALTEAGAETVIRRWADFEAVLAALTDWALED